jgi:phytoene dehydrogenase-like protein
VTRFDAVVVGAGTNGLTAAIVLARAGLSVRVVEANDAVGGAARTAALTLPGFAHDLGSAVHPLAVGSPIFRALPLADHRLRWLQPDVALAHPLDDAPPALLTRDVDDMAGALGADAPAYRALVAPFAERWDALAPDVLGPLVHWPAHPLLLTRFGLAALQPMTRLAERTFRGAAARALLGGIAAHSAVPGTHAGTASFALVLAAAAHAGGWPVAAGGSQAISDALASYLRALGGEIATGERVASLDALPRARVVLLAVTPRQLLALAGDRLPAGYRRALASYRYGPGAFKVDWALDGPVPWRDADCARAGTVHLGGRLEEIVASEAAVWRGEHPARPFVLLAQPSRVDPSRAPAGREALWGYCHVPNGSTVDVLPHIEAQIERFAPGFRDRILARHVAGPRALEAADANLVGGDISGGANTLWQLFSRPVARWVPYGTPIRGVYLCSASTPPGGGVHGMCGYRAAALALRHDFGLTATPLIAH